MLKKPFEVEQLDQAIEKLLQQRLEQLRLKP
jgi:hypothetical protein